MQMKEIEGLAIKLRRAAGANDEAIISLVDVIVHWMGRRSVERVDSLAGRATLVTVNERSRIMIRRGAPDLRFATAHEFGHWAFRNVARVTFLGMDEEKAANIFAAAILAPQSLVRRAYEFFGEDTKEIADQLCLSQTSVVLRLGEVRGDPRAVVTRTGHVFTRNADATFTSQRASAAARGKPSRGLAKARLRGGIDEGRVALRAV